VRYVCFKLTFGEALAMSAKRALRSAGPYKQAQHRQASAYYELVARNRREHNSGRNN
jgi:hypothetical protein